VGSQYYYFISSLPYLRLGEEPKIRSEEFLDLCSYCLDQEIGEQLKDVQLIPREDSFFAVERVWNAFDTCMRNALVRVRASRVKREGSPYIREEKDAFSHIESQIQDAWSKDPLSMEEQLDRLRWQVLEDLAVGHNFDENALFLYRVKLLLLEKRLGLNPSEGQIQLDRSLDKALEESSFPANLGAD